jgi:hypothetical protein
MNLTAAQLSTGSSPSWLSDAFAALKNTSSDGIMGALQNSGDGSISSFFSQMSSGANAFATIAQSSVSNTSSLVAQMASQNLQTQSTKKLQEALDGLNAQQNMVEQKNVLDPFIYFGDGSYLDTDSNILTMSDGTQFDTTTGAKYVDPASIVQMANGAYLNTTTNVLTMSDGTQIDVVTGLKVSQLA